MIKILIVDDETEKATQIVRVLLETSNSQFSIDDIDTARDATGAKQLLKENHYDLLILDIALPLRIDQDPDPNGGLNLLEEITKRKHYFIPGHIVGLTAYDKIKEVAEDKMASGLWSLVLYDRTSDKWATQLQEKLAHIIAAKLSSQSDVQFECDLCIVTALRDPELLAVLNLPWNWSTFEDARDITQYYQGEYTQGDKNGVVYAASAPQMGIAAAAALTMKMIQRFKPKYVAMAGILAGAKDATELGDVVLASPCWDWGSGKHHKVNDAQVFSVSPFQLSASPVISAALNRIKTNSSLLDEIRNSWQGMKPATQLQIHEGPVASGASVLADDSIFAEIKKQQRKTLGIDMEAYGVMTAVQLAQIPQPKVFVIKAVCDFADEKKNDNFQHYAAYTSAKVLEKLVTTLL